jgi:thiol-disulfide isomerase/thioredoxin
MAINMKNLLLILVFLFSTSLSADVLDISDFSLAQYRGKVVYLDFWASWCKPCQKSFPWMNAIQKKYPSDRFQVVTINLDEDSAEMTKFLSRVPAEFTVYHDATGKAAETFQLEGMPTSFLINAEGNVVNKHIGFYESRKAAYEQEIEALL